MFGAGNAAVNERQISKLCNNIENKSILGLVENMSDKMSMIEKQSLEQTESRLQAISVRVSQLNDKKSLFEDQEKLNRVNELYTIVSKWKDMSALVPSVVSRLTALNDIHQKGTSIFLVVPVNFGVLFPIVFYFQKHLSFLQCFHVWMQNKSRSNKI